MKLVTECSTLQHELFLEVKFMTCWTKASEEVISHYHTVTGTYKGCDSTALPAEL